MAPRKDLLQLTFGELHRNGPLHDSYGAAHQLTNDTHAPGVSRWLLNTLVLNISGLQRR